MKKFHLLFVLMLFLFTACKKDSVDATNLQSFQSSINDMSSKLSTIQQYKFNEALYILKTFGVEADGDAYELTLLSKMLEGKKVPEIFALADQVAQKHGIDWTSSGPPSLGTMNIFEDVAAKESDPNDVAATALHLSTRNGAEDPVLGVRELIVKPALVDGNGNNVAFSGAALEVTMDVYSGGVKIYSSKNMMQDQNFPGFTLRFQSLPAEKIIDDKVDITVAVVTTKKTLKMTNVGVPVNPKMLRAPKPVIVSDSASTETAAPAETPMDNGSTVPAAGDPRVTVQKFLNGLSTQNLRSAYETSSNPGWGSYEKFSNPTSGFGAVKNLTVKNISGATVTEGGSTVNATYDITDKNGNTSSLSVTFGLKNINGEWKISSYKLN